MSTANDAMWPGIDYCNSRTCDFRDVTKINESDLKNTKEEPRMPWHDIGLRLLGEAVTDVARHFI